MIDQSNRLNKLKFKDNELFYNVIVELGFLRMSDLCADCGKKIKIPNYHIQLCQDCRFKYMDRYNPLR
jgi:DNA-directed RNA polymerase subunit RPC12/RpoP